MAFFKRIRAKPVPSWAQGFMDAGQYEAFGAALQADLRSRGWTYRQQDDGIFIDGASGTKPIAFGLTNLAQTCAGMEWSDWPAAVKAHFDNLLAVPDGGAERTWDGVRRLLKLRIVPADTAREHDLVSYPLTPGLVAVLAVDYPTAVQMVRAPTIAQWPAVDELYRVALENLRADPSPEWKRVGDGPEAFMGMFDDSFFTAARVLLFPDGVNLGDASDAVVSMPSRHVLLVHPIRDLGVVKATRNMTVHTARVFAEGPGSIASDLFWWHAGALTTIPVTFDGKATSMYPPDAFVERLKVLAEPDSV